MEATGVATPVDVWAPAFYWLEPREMKVEAFFALFNRRGVGRWCKACETDVPHAELDAHVDEHRRELSEWRAAARRRAREEES